MSYCNKRNIFKIKAFFFFANCAKISLERGQDSKAGKNSPPQQAGQAKKRKKTEEIKHPERKRKEEKNQEKKKTGGFNLQIAPPYTKN